MRQIDMFDNKMSVYDENKVLVGNVCTSGQRVVELELVLVSPYSLSLSVCVW